MASGRWRSHTFRVSAVLLTILAALQGTGCVAKIEKGKKLEPSGYTVLAKEDVPEELAERIEQKKEKPFEITYEDQGVVYGAKGYGAQLTSGYSIRINEVYLAKEGVTMDTTLLGPERTKEKEQVTTFPYVVIQILTGK